MNIKYLTKYDVFLATIKRWQAVDKLMWDNFKLETDENVISGIMEAQRDNNETEREMNARFGI